MERRSPSKKLPSREETPSTSFDNCLEHTLHYAILMTETSMGMRERCASGEKYIMYLRNLSVRAAKNLAALQAVNKSFLVVAQKLVISAMVSVDDAPPSTRNQTTYDMKLEFEKLLYVIEKELNDIEEVDAIDLGTNVSEKIKYLQARQRLSDSPFLPRTSSVKSFKSDVDEKYPENLSRESLIDLNTVVNLPPVPEDIFATFSNKPVRTSSLSSLKSMRKVKLFLQKAASLSDDDDLSSDIDEQEPPKFVTVRSTNKN